MRILNTATNNITYATLGSAAFDLRARIPSSYSVGGDEFPGSTAILPGEWKAIETDLRLDVAHSRLDECLLILPRSGLALRYGVTVLNSPGLIDPDYAGEIKVILINHGKNAFCVTDGDRIAQGLIVRCETLLGIERAKKERNDGGFGSTGKV
jgi:dUTP pyrophosphatase